MMVVCLDDDVDARSATASVVGGVKHTRSSSDSAGAQLLSRLRHSLVGELSNILGNFDPVGNEFEQTVDNLDVRSRRFEVFWWFPFVDGTRLQE